MKCRINVVCTCIKCDGEGGGVDEEKIHMMWQFDENATQNVL